STREARDGDLREREPNGRERPPKAEPRASGWELRVHADRKSIVLTDLIRLPDEHASRLRLD
ncbi:MAG: hypothetical protein H7125_01565, partial [Proteobacteria bacterium]|nr:hypothetical protein [Burkholderiales bacterium]